MAYRLGILIFVLAAPAFACLHFAKQFAGKVDEGTQFAFVFHDGKLAHLVTKADVHAKEGKLPPKLSWVLPFPSLPTKYEEASSELLPELAGALSEVRLKAWGAPRGPIKVHETRDVGNYQITPIEITGDGATKPLNDWLAANGYNPMPEDLQKPYLKKGAAFVAITLKLDGKDASIKPLHVAYPAKDLTVPIKFTHDDRTFDAVLFVFSAKAVEKAPEYFKVTTSIPYEAKQLKRTAKLLGERKGFLTRLEARGLNREGKKLRQLAADPHFVP